VYSISTLGYRWGNAGRLLEWKSMSEKLWHRKLTNVYSTFCMAVHKLFSTSVMKITMFPRKEAPARVYKGDITNVLRGQNTSTNENMRLLRSAISRHLPAPGRFLLTSKYQTGPFSLLAWAWLPARRSGLFLGPPVGSEDIHRCSNLKKKQLSIKPRRISKQSKCTSQFDKKATKENNWQERGIYLKKTSWTNRIITFRNGG